MRTYIDNRYKLTVYHHRDYGELFDLGDDPDEAHNLWDDAAAAPLKTKLMEALLRAEIHKEEPLISDRQHWPNKSAAMTIKSCTEGRYQINYEPDTEAFSLFDIETDPRREHNLWSLPSYKQVQQQMVRALLFLRMTNEPVWMPRISGA
jgi:hypothetical protein